MRLRCLATGLYLQYVRRDKLRDYAPAESSQFGKTSFGGVLDDVETSVPPHLIGGQAEASRVTDGFLSNHVRPANLACGKRLLQAAAANCAWPHQRPA